MKKHLLIALVLGLSTTICHSQVKISVQGGTGLTGITQNENYNANFGYRFGVGVEFPIDKTWSMQTGLQLLNRSYSIDEAVTALGITETGKQIYMGLGIDSKINGIYLQVPIKVAAYLPLNNNCGLQFSGGPYIALGIGGKSKLNSSLHAMTPWDANYQYDSRVIGVTFAGRNMEDTADDIVHIVMNSHWEGHQVCLPDLPNGQDWYIAVNTFNGPDSDCVEEVEDMQCVRSGILWIQPRSVVILVAQ